MSNINKYKYMPLQPNEGSHNSTDEDTPDKPKTSNKISDIEIVAEIYQIKANITPEIITLYSQELKDRLKTLFDELKNEEKQNVIMFSMLSSKTLKSLELNPHFIAGLHSKDVLLLIRINKACEIYKKFKTRTSIKHLFSGYTT